MNKRVKNILPDLIIGTCPLGCNKTCVKAWINDSIEHRIIYNCICHNDKKYAALVQVEGLEAKATSTCGHSGGISK